MSLSKKQIGQAMIWSCVGMAYFNAVSTLNLEPIGGLLLATIPIALLGTWMKRSIDRPNSLPDD